MFAVHRGYTLLALALCLVAIQARADEPQLVAVLPLNAPKLDKDLRETLEEAIRTVAGDVLSPRGYIVLTGDNTLRVLSDNNIDAAKACEASCALDAAKNLKASLFISGSATLAEGAYVAYVRLFEGQLGRQLGSVELDGATVKALRDQMRDKADSLFHAVTTTPLPGSSAPTVLVTPPPSDSGTSGPVVKRSKVSAAVGSLLVFVKPADRVRLSITDPDGRKVDSGVPYDNRAAKPGNWKVTASADGYQGDERIVDVPPDEPTELKFNLKRLGSLTVSATPADRVRLDIEDPDGVKVASGVPYRNGAAKAGQWKVIASASGYEAQSNTVSVPLETPMEIGFDLKPFGSLKIDGSPRGSAVNVSGPGGFHDAGGLPWEASGLKSGPYQVHVAQDGYAPDDETAEVNAGKEASLNVKLMKLNAPPPERESVPAAALTDEPAPSPKSGGSAARAWGIAALVVGAVGLAVGTGCGIAAGIQTTAGKANAQSPNVGANVNAVNSLATGALVGWVGGGVLAATGIGLVVAF